MEQVAAELPLIDQFGQVAVGCGDHPDIDRDDGVAADAADFLFFQGAQQARLQGLGQVADFIEKQTAAVGQFEQPAAAAFAGAGKGSLGVTEQFGFEAGFPAA